MIQWYSDFSSYFIKKKKRKKIRPYLKDCLWDLRNLHIHGWGFNNTFPVEWSLKMFIIKNRRVKKKKKKEWLTLLLVS